MKYRVLVIDDDPDVITFCKEVMHSLGLVADYAACQDDARQLLHRNDYDLILLDLGLPAFPRGLSRIETGENLLREIRSMPGFAETPVIIITGHGADTCELAVRMMKLGANDYVVKPLDQSGPRSIDKAIWSILENGQRPALDLKRAPTAQFEPRLSSAPPEDHLGEATAQQDGDGHMKPGLDDAPHPISRISKASASRERKPKIFHGGTIHFYPERVELLGCQICGGEEAGVIRRLLDALKVSQPDGRHRVIKHADLMKVLGTKSENAVANAVYRARGQICEALRKQAQMTCGDKDVICTTSRGVTFSGKVTIRDHVPANVPQSAKSEPQALAERAVAVVPAKSTETDGSTPADTPRVPEAERKKRILHLLENGDEVRTPELALKFGVDQRTVKRDIEDLRQQNPIVFIGPAKTGYYAIEKQATVAGTQRSKPI